jgi:hypothetical protein
LSKPKVIFIVGHSNWGKSQTLRKLTAGSHRVRRKKIAGIEYFIRRMSNDDQPEGFIKRMAAMDPVNWPYILAALCPDFTDASKATAKVLQGLKDKGYRLFFWVQVQQYGTSETIQRIDISRLRSFGQVKVFSSAAEADIRAKELKAYITTISTV